MKGGPTHAADEGRGFLGLIAQPRGQAIPGAASKVTRLWWVRHAPVSHGGRIVGQTDLSCDCSNTALFTELSERLPRSAIWVTSNLRRTRETAAAIIRAGLPEPGAVPGPDAIELAELAEQDFGAWQGLTYEELEASHGADFDRFRRAPADETPPSGESFAAVIERVSRAVHRLLKAHPGCDIISVAHGGTIRAALALALGLDPEAALAFTIENYSITRIDHIDGPGMGRGWRVVTVNRPPR